MQDSQLDNAISAIRVRFGSQALTRAAELPPPQPWSSGTPLDRLTGIGGLPRGRLTLLTGSGTSGKLTLALAHRLPPRARSPSGLPPPRAARATAPGSRPLKGGSRRLPWPAPSPLRRHYRISGAPQ